MTTSANDIRRSFLKYFESHGHRIVPSSPLVPHEDPTLLFTNAGMNQFKDTFLGKEKRDYTRATTSQKCMRVSGKHNDLENVGPSLRHHTFFEMLGNFSFGDYFKKDAIEFAWTLLTDVWQMPADRLIVSIFKGEAGIPRDDEAYDIWRRFVPAGKIVELGADDNFWQMGDTGPCGRCTEIYYVRGTGQDPEIEIWNNVFMEFDRQPGGVLTPLPAPSIDTGMGLERVTSVLQGKQSNYDTDLFTPILAEIGRLSGHAYRGTMEASDVSMRVIADHIRATTFLIADGVMPSNEFRGYVLRKIMRRAMRHGKHLGLAEPFMHQIVGILDREMGDAYPEIRTNRGMVEQTILAEEKQFAAVLIDGLPRLEKALDEAAARGTVVAGDVAFRLYDTYGLPKEFIEDMIETRALTLDREGFDAAMKSQRDKARAKSKFGPGDSRATGLLELASRFAEDLTAIGDQFVGYDATTVPAKVLDLYDAAGHEVEFLEEGTDGLVLLATSPFYVESGGQASDSGTISTVSGEATVTDVKRMKQPDGAVWPRLHVVRVERGRLRVGEIATATVNSTLRDATRRNHTGTHLLHAALRQVLGSHVKQAGSLVAPDRLRFDFVHFSAITREQLLDIERIVNEQVLKNTPVQTDVKNTQEAIAGGAMALFGEKYGDKVRVVSIPDFSTELCGGTHVRATGDIGLFAIVSEGGVAAGTRRIEAMTGLDSMKAFQRDRDELAVVASALNARPGELSARVAALQDETRRLTRELQQAKMKAAIGGGGAAGQADEAVEVAGVKLIAREVSGLDKDGLRALVDRLRDHIKSGVVVLAAPSDGKISVVVGVTPDLTKKAPAGEIVKQLAPLVGGRGGGRADFAEAGGKDASKVAEMLAASRGVVEKLLSVP